MNRCQYDVENRLVWHGNGAGTTLAGLRYDPLGRLYELYGSANGAGTGYTRFLYDGDALVAEYNTSGTLLRRYVHGSDAGADDPLLWFEGTSTSFANARHLYADPRGSIVLVGSSNGNVIAINSYDEYGIPAAGNQGRFQYTGQAWLPELGMYYYKARIYSPTLGRFLQTDPIGYEDQWNLYAYVGNDPVNLVDFTGECLGPVAIPCAIKAGELIGLGAAAACAATGACEKVAEAVVKGAEAIVDAMVPDKTPTVVPGAPPKTGEPGTTTQGRGTTRRYGPDGYPEVDVDKPNPGAKSGATDADDHAHDWQPRGEGEMPERGPHRPLQEGDPPPPHRGEPEREVR